MHYEITEEGVLEIVSGELLVGIDPTAIDVVDFQDDVLIIFFAEAVVEAEVDVANAKSILEQLLGMVTPAARVNINFTLARLNTLQLINNRI